MLLSKARPRSTLRLVIVLLALVLEHTETNCEERNAPRWHLQRVVQRNRLSQALIYSTGRSKQLSNVKAQVPVNIYVVDSGVRITHEEFEDRAEHGPNFAEDGTTSDDCQGHGTHVAALAAGKYSGIAPTARVISVRILDCRGAGYCRDVIRALQWVHDDAVERMARGERAVVVMSIGSTDHRCGPTIQQTDELLAKGIFVAAASGNSVSDSCHVYPAMNNATISVGATNLNDQIYSKNNVGSCIDIFAPGVNVLSAWGTTSDTEYKQATGTSMATPLVAGTAALILGADRKLNAVHARSIILQSATRNKIEAGVQAQKRLPDVSNALLYAPWSELFVTIPRDDRSHRSLSRQNSSSQVVRAMRIRVNFTSRVTPAMAYSCERIRLAAARSAHVPMQLVTVRRSETAKPPVSGMEPPMISLCIYIKRISEDAARRLEADARSGALARFAGEQLAFLKSLSGNVVESDVEVPPAVFDYQKHEDRNAMLSRIGIIIISVATAISVIALVIMSVLIVSICRLLTMRKKSQTLGNEENNGGEHIRQEESAEPAQSDGNGSCKPKCLGAEVCVCIGYIFD